MIIIAMLLLSAQQPEHAGMPPADKEIVVLAQRLRTVRWRYDAKDGVLIRCTIKQSGGLVADGLVCEASRQCAAENPTVGDRHLASCIKARVGKLYAMRRAAEAPSASQH